MAEYLVCTEEIRVQLAAGPFSFEWISYSPSYSLNVKKEEIPKKKDDLSSSGSKNKFGVILRIKCSHKSLIAIIFNEISSKRYIFQNNRIILLYILVDG